MHFYLRWSNSSQGRPSALLQQIQDQQPYLLDFANFYLAIPYVNESL